ncbi:MAG: hypothetical protein P8188_10115 [Gemmatimonadota bacterium]
MRISSIVPRTALAVVMLSMLVGRTSAQEPRPASPETEDLRADSLAMAQRPSPLGAFLRAIAIPSWGHGSIGSHHRRTGARRSSARETLQVREVVVRAELVAAGVPEEELDDAVVADPRVVDAQNLVDAREGQFEDWAALGIFLVLLSGADAFVSAHLQDFPDPIDVQVGPTPDGGVEVGARVRVGGR